MTSSEAAFYAERIAQKEHEFNDLQTAFNKYKLKNSVKFDHLRKEITLYCNNHGLPIVEKENNALLLLRLAEMENALEVTRRDAESLHHELSRRQIQMNDQFILIKNLEEQLHVASPLSSAELEERKRALQNIDLDIVHQQMIYKDERIVELNNVILDKERQILDLQEMCREQGEVANSKTQAMRIVQKKFEELENRGHREVATETDNWLWMQQHIQRREREPIVNGVNRANSGRSQSPGHAVANRSGSSSPPPLDPSEAENKAAFIREDDEDLMGLPTFQGKNLDQEASLRKKQRKRVTFDLPPAASRLELDMVTANDEIAITLHHLSDENLQLRKELNEQTTSMVEIQQKMQQVDSELTRVVREGKAQSLKARAVAQGRIKDLEDRMAEFNQQHSAQVDRLQTEIETLRSTREWEVEQNAKLREQITQIRDKNHKLTEELDASEQANRDTELKVIQGEELMERMVEDLAEAESIIRYMEEQKHSILDDVDSLKEALIAQDQFIEILEADIVIYEEHIGILRESLGASKVDHRSLIRSKAFETKLKALEKEKEQIDRRSSEDRLRTKALDQKCKMLEEENEKLMGQLCEHEMKTRDEADMVDTCYQLEERIRLAEAKMAEERVIYERRIEAALREADRERCEVVKLLNDLNNAQLEIAQAKERKSQEDRLRSDNCTDVSKETTVDSDEEANNKINEQDSELKMAHMEIENLLAKYRQVSEEMEAMHGTNFDLMTKSEEISRLLKEAHQDNERLRLSKNQLHDDIRRIVAEKDIIQQQSHSALEDANKRIDLLQKDMLGMKTELENARLSLQETNAVRIELEHLREELELEKSSGRAKWEAVCKKMLETENDPESRKSSLEVQQQYATTYDEKIQILEKDLEEARSRIEQDKLEKKKLKTAIKQLKNKEYIDANLYEQFPLETHNTKSNIAIQVNTADTQEINSLKEKIQVLELETRISGELNVEFGQAMMEMEEEVKSLKVMQENMKTEAHHSEMELRLHEMLEEELGNELEEMKNKEKELLERLEMLEVAREKRNGQEDQVFDVGCDLNSIERASHRLPIISNELERLRTENAELREDIADNAERIATYERVRWQEKEAAEKIKLIHSDEVRTLSVAVDEAQCVVSNLEARLSETEKQFEESQITVADLQRLLNEKLHYCEKLQVENNRLQNLLNSEQHNVPRDSATIDITGNYLCASQDLELEVTDSFSYKETSSEDKEVKFDQSVKSDKGSDVVKSDVFEENAILRQCVNETSQMHEEMSQDMERLLELKTELENAVDVLKGEIWSLNGQLKASILDRENLQDRIVALDTNLTAEKKRADALDSELQEQTELTEKATRQAAEAENQSNRRLAECLEMETIREQLERDYAKLNEYYGQLQAAYNVIYAQLKLKEKSMQEEVESDQTSTNDAKKFDEDSIFIADNIISDLELEIPSDSTFSAKLIMIQQTIATRQLKAEENLCIIAEQRKINDALQKRLESLEEETQRTGGESKTTRERLLELNGDLEWKKEECVLLQRRVNELQSIIEILAEQKSEDNAAKLTSSQADVNSLFRANAELAHTNVRLQNELDESRETNVQDKTIEVESIVEIADNMDHNRANVQNEADEKVLRLETVEKLLNKRIYCLEEQLLEAEEKLQDIEDELHEERERAKLESIKLANIETELIAERNVRQNVEKQLENMIGIQTKHEIKCDRDANTCRSIEDALSADKDVVLQKTELKQAKEESISENNCKSEGLITTTRKCINSQNYLSNNKDVEQPDEINSGLIESTSVLEKNDTIMSSGSGVANALSSDIHEGWCWDEDAVTNSELIEHISDDTTKHEKANIEFDCGQTIDDHIEQQNEWGWEENSQNNCDNVGILVDELRNSCEQQLIEINTQLQQKTFFLDGKESEESALRNEILEFEQSKATKQERERKKSNEQEDEPKKGKSVEIENIKTMDTELEENMTNSSSVCELIQLRSELARLTDELNIARTAISELNSQAVEKQEAWCWEEQSNQNELETLRDELRRVQDELDSTECERRRLEDELVRSHGLVDKLNAELLLQKTHTDDALNILKHEESTQENVSLAIENEELSESVKEIIEEKVDMDKPIEKNQTEEKLHEELQKLRNELAICHKELTNIQQKLDEKNIQNDLLKDSEGRLIDSVDDYRKLMEVYKEKAEKFESDVKKLEEGLKTINEKLQFSERRIRDLEAVLSDARNGTDRPLSSQQVPCEYISTRGDWRKIRLKTPEIQKTESGQRNQSMNRAVIRPSVVSLRQTDERVDRFRYMPSSSPENLDVVCDELIDTGVSTQSFSVQGVAFPVQVTNNDVIRRRSNVSNHGNKIIKTFDFEQ